ncbi:hypothetical protein DICPUDRAFT_44467 [Dictyostelium purpureum]|uniref:CRAL-TRIO domain-containing protein n=1 Tax=Dictyostelium purpureum TaxID=5786 RepID=F1A6D0_DICPU|nr:uncharacterized protein DICPUDRAFT_44467 [Dictyostelium purpureum]EGC28251.1 hypothetical protein DICPUDRAFT_44467 [Dictyostelium purpureum]|eukprot:XP_003295224.1 hypothetical protein DICPUDRAFT_44467 [Dictyostelium purpureum]
MSGYVGDLSIEQQRQLDIINNKVKELKDPVLQNEINNLDDSMVLRFLRARKWNEKDSFEMLHEALKFRATFQNIGVNGIKPDMVENELKSGKSYFHGIDKGGRPVCVVKTSKHDSYNRDLDESMRYCVFVMENGKQMLKPGIETCTLIFDMSDFSSKNMDYPLVKFMVELFQKFYPESLQKCLILNAPWIFMGIWHIIKHWLDPNTASKVSFVKTKQLADYIPKDQLEKNYGGTSDFVYTYKTPVVDDSKQVEN